MVSQHNFPHTRTVLNKVFLPNSKFQEWNDQSRTDDNDIKNVPKFLNKFETTEGVKLGHNFQRKNGQEKPFSAVQLKADKNGIRKNSQIKKVSEVNVLDASDENFRIFWVVQFWAAFVRQWVPVCQAVDAQVRQLVDVGERLEVDVADVVLINDKPNKFEEVGVFLGKRFLH